MAHIKNNLKKLRIAKNLTKEQLAKKLGYSVSGYSKIEAGERNLKVNTALLAAQLLDCSLEDIILDPNMPNREY